MKNWTIVKQIHVGMGGLIAGIAIVSAIAIYSTLNLSQRFGDFDDMVKTNQIAGALEEDLFEARVAAIKYRVSGDPVEITEFEDNMADISQDRAALTELVSDDANLTSTIKEMYAAANVYQSAFEASILKQRERESAMASYDEIRARVLSSLNNASTTGRAIGNLQAQADASAAMQLFLEGLIEYQEFLFSNSPTDLEKSLGLLASAKTAMARQGDATAALFEAPNSAIEEFAALADATAAAIYARNEHFARMDEVGPVMIRATEAVLDAVHDKQDTVSAEAQALSATTQVMTATTAAICILLGGFAAFWISRWISRQLAASIHRIDALAKGDLDIDIPNDGDATEVARINTAMVTFRENLVETKRLEAEAAEAAERERAAQEERDRVEAARLERERVEEAERAEKARLAEEAQREREEEEAREREEVAQREQEAARAKVIGDLQTAVGAVVEDAARGDFSSRITASFDDETLDALAGRINALLGVVETGVSAAGEAIAGLAKGDLGARMRGDFAGDFRDLQVNIGDAMSSLGSLVEEIAVSGEAVHDGSTEISSSSDELARRTESAAASIQETTAAVQEINASLQDVSKNVSEATAVAQEARSEAENSGEVVKTAVSVMGEIASSSTRISSIIDVIEDISFQINLLALNAGVEAARAGDAGRGFSVVAAEVRALAQRTSEAVGDITSLISESSENVDRGASSVEKASKALENIAKGVIDISDRMGSIAGAVEEQATGVDGISHAVSELDRATQHNAAMCEEVTAACASLTDESQTLKSSIGRFSGANSSNEEGVSAAVGTESREAA